MKSPGGNLITYLLNLGTRSVSAILRYEGLSKELEMYVYQASEAAVSKSDYRMDPLRQWKMNSGNPGPQESLPPRSITVLSSLALKHTDNGIVLDKAANTR